MAYSGDKLVSVFNQSIEMADTVPSSVSVGFTASTGKVPESHQDPPTTAAVKKISATSKQGEKECFAEICTIGRLRHKNIVQLQGWCHEGEHLLLVYEYMPNGNLDRYIGRRSLDWETKFKILTGLASALLYLHEDSGTPVVHRDVKPSNVTLDEDFNAHLGDFWLARLLQNDASVTTMLAGTLRIGPISRLHRKVNTRI
ncbi:hypothetical protein CRYUN_Cryun02cG0059200 [Craigia yunnanensis]